MLTILNPNPTPLGGEILLQITTGNPYLKYCCSLDDITVTEGEERNLFAQFGLDKEGATYGCNDVVP